MRDYLPQATEWAMTLEACIALKTRTAYRTEKAPAQRQFQNLFREEPLGLTDRDDRVNSIVAERIIELAKAGERNPDILCEQALKGLRSQRTSKQFQSTTNTRK
jgi:hypothetical protein